MSEHNRADFHPADTPFAITVELIMALEEEFNVEIPDEDAEKMVTVGDALRYLKDNVK